MRYLMSEIVQFSSIFTLTLTHHVTLTMNDLKNIFVVSIIHLTELKIIKIVQQILEILFFPDSANYGY